MLESCILWSMAWVLLAGTSVRLRRDAGLVDRRDIRAARVFASMLTIGAVVAAGGDVPGERWVRALAIASLTASFVALCLSVFSRQLLAPVRITARAFRGVPERGAATVETTLPGRR